MLVLAPILAEGRQTPGLEYFIFGSMEHSHSTLGGSFDLCTLSGLPLRACFGIVGPVPKAGIAGRKGAEPMSE